MKATLRVKYVEDAIDEHFPSVVTVALKDLYPTLGQCSSIASYSIKHVAECIDQMRYLHYYAWNNAINLIISIYAIIDQKMKIFYNNKKNADII